MEAFAAYLPIDRRQALARNLTLPDRSEGTALFADISGFTPLTEALTRSLGPRRGAEELTLHLNSVYQALIQEVERHGGSVIAFAGDAITCWFESDAGGRATTCALAIQATMSQFSNVQLANQEAVALGVKIGIASGPVRRFLAGDPEIQILDVLAGRTLLRMASAAHLASRGEILVTPEIASCLGKDLKVLEWRQAAEDTQSCAVVGGCQSPATIPPWQGSTESELNPTLLRPWLIRPVYDRLRSGHGDFLTELRPAVALFVRFSGIDYDQDVQAGAKLNSYVSWVQKRMAQYEGFLIDVTVGDKGSYLYGCFGAPIAHENDAWRAASTALELCAPPADFDFIQGTHIGISRGTMRTGAYGAVSRRTYGVLGDEVNLAARLMEHAKAGQVLVSDRLRRAAGESFSWQMLPPTKLKGKTEPLCVWALKGHASAANWVAEPQYALQLVGRRAELAIIEEILAKVRNRTGRVLCISAEAGMGKSRLAAEATRLARDKGLVAHRGECQSHGVHTSYLPWQGIWRSLFGLNPADSLSAQIAALEQRLAQINPVLVSRLPLLGPVLSLPIPENDVTRPLEARLRKASLEALLVECLRAISETTPLLLLLEDTHWIDALSQELLDVVARSIGQHQVLLVFTQRPRQPGHIQVHGLEHLPYFAELSLNAFTDDEAQTLIQLKLEQLFEFKGQTPPLLCNRLMARAAGNPFYLEELLNFLKDETVDFTNGEALANLELPASLHTLVLSRIDRLTETQQTTLKLASVVGRVFPAAVVRELEPEPERPRVAEDLQALCQADLTVMERPEPELVYLFKHVVTQEVTYESLAHATRTKLHNQIGLCLEQLFQVRLEQQVDLLAFHFDRSLNLEKKKHYLALAGRAAQANYANAAAISYFERVLPLLQGPERMEILLNLGKVRELTGEWKKAGASYQQAFESADQIQDHCGKARCQAAIGDLLRKQGFFAEATNWLGLARTGFEDIKDRPGLGQTLHALGTVAAMQGNYPEARSFYEQSLEIRRQLADQPQTASLLSNLGIIARFNGQYDQARELMEQSLAIRRQVGDRWAIANSLNNLGVLLRDLRQFSSARTLLEESLSLNRQVGDRWAVANVLSSLGELTIDQQDWTAAQAFLAESLQTNLDLNDRTAVAFVLECFASMAAIRNDAPRALRLAGAAANLRITIGSPLSPAEQQRLDKSLEAARQAIPPEDAQLYYEQGGKLSLEEATAVVLPGA